MIELTDQIRRYAEAVNEPGAIGPDPAEGTLPGSEKNRDPSGLELTVPSLRSGTTTATRDGRAGGRRLWWLVAASVVIAFGAAAWLRNNHDQSVSVSAGAAAHVIPPADASDVSVYAVPGGQTVTYRDPDGQYMSIDNLSQVSGGVEVSTGEQTWLTPGEEFAREVADPGSRQFTVDGLGQVNVRCATSGTNGTEANAVTSYFGPLQASLVIGTRLVGFRESSPPAGPAMTTQAMTDWQQQACSPPSAAPPLLDQLARLRTTDEAGWASFIATAGQSADTRPAG